MDNKVTTVASNMAMMKNNRKSDLINYNLDHLYCHTNNDKKYIRSNSGASTGASTNAEMVGVLKEIKQLKAMLLLHLDLIQEQSDQLTSKDKQLTSLKKENEQLKLKIDRLDRRTKILSRKSESPILTKSEQHQQPQHSSGITTTTTAAADKLTESNAKCDILKKISTTLLSTCRLKLNALSDTFEEKYKILDFIDEIPQLTSSSSSEAKTTSNQLIPAPMTTNDIILSQKNKDFDEVKNKISNDNRTKLTPTTNAKKSISPKTTNSSSSNPIITTTTPNNTNNLPCVENSSIIGESNGRFISKIVLQRVHLGDIGDTQEVVIKNDLNLNELEKIIDDPIIKLENNLGNLFPDSYLQDDSNAAIKTEEIDDKTINDTQEDDNIIKNNNYRISLGFDNIVRKRLHSSIEDDDDDEVKADGEADTIREASSSSQISDILAERRPSVSTTPTKVQKLQEDGPEYTNSRSIMQTQKLYFTREWQMNEIEAEVNNQITDVIIKPDDEINLEIPRWNVIKECSGVYSIEGTEDLSDNVFNKRHAKFELDERKRKKWDVQRIREQRTIERLKRRHCKDEVLNSNLNETMMSFFPSAENIKFVQITDDLPVQAFGEPIPLLNSVDFSLPWLNHRSFRGSTIASTLPKHTSIVFAKKKIVRRHYTASTSSTASTTANRVHVRRGGGGRFRNLQ